VDPDDGVLLAGELAPQDAWATDIFALLVNYAAIEADLQRAYALIL
jgi:hypothetical protein